MEKTESQITFAAKIHTKYRVVYVVTATTMIGVTKTLGASVLENATTKKATY